MLVNAMEFAEMIGRHTHTHLTKRHVHSSAKWHRCPSCKSKTGGVGYARASTVHRLVRTCCRLSTGIGWPSTAVG